MARSSQQVEDTGYRWHPAPDGGACFLDGDGWIYTSNSEVSPGGGVGAIKFSADGSILDAYRILDGTHYSCAGGPAPWGTWLSGEEFSSGRVWETDPGASMPRSSGLRWVCSSTRRVRSTPSARPST